MNANELADYITQNSYIGTVTMEDVATMLRQQQAEIERLKAKTLTDEEIAVLIAPVPIRPLYEDLVLFTRAILRKAQEK